MGKLTRRDVIGRKGYWLLEFELGGRPWRFATEEVTINSRELGGDVVFSSGLTGINFELETETATLEVRAADPITWARSRRRLGPLTARPFILRRWYQGDLEDSQVALQGTIEAAAFGDSRQPTRLALKLARDLEGQGAVVPTPEMQITSDTLLSGSGVSSNSPSSIGQWYPVILGTPGTRQNASDTSAPSGASPAFPWVCPAMSAWTYLIAGHEVEAGEVWVWDMGASVPTPFVATVDTIQDDLGRTISTISVSQGTIPGEDGREILIGWQRYARSGTDPDAGPGLLHNGTPVVGLGDLLIWGYDALSTAAVDWAEMYSRRASLNRFRVDAVINEPVNWEEWLQSEVLGLFDIEPVHGPHGLYYREIEYTADPVHVRAKLTTEPGGAGWRVQREGQIEDSGDPVYNQISLRFGPYMMSTTAFEFTRTLGPSPSRYEGWTPYNPDGSGGNNLNFQSPLAVYSTKFYKVRSKQWKSVIIWQTAAATALLQKKLEKHAVPAQMVTYQGGYELADLREYDTVELEDTREGADFPAGTLAIVWRITLEDQDTYRVQLRVPFDLIRSPQLGT